MEGYKAVYRGGTGEITEKKSRFIAHVSKAETVEEAQAFIDRIKKQYWDARHNCSAFSVGHENVLTRSSDDGEPAGTAGKPILEVINGSQIHNIVIVVTRYFGGTLLGTGGLVRAYTDAARAGIEGSVIIDNISAARVIITIEYTELGKVQYILAQNNVDVLDTRYSDKVEIEALFRDEEYKRLKKLLMEATSAKAALSVEEQVHYGLAEGRVILL